MSNIAEGFERNNDKEFYYFLRVAKGSSGEVRSQLFVAYDAGYIDKPTLAALGQKCIEVSCRIAGLARYLQRGINRDQKPSDVDDI